MHKGVDPQRTFGMWLAPTSNRIDYRISTTADSNEGGETVILPVNRWIHVVYQKSGSTLRMYFDGQLKRLEPLAGASVHNTGPLYLGRDQGYAGTDCQMDEVRIYNRALTGEEIAALARGPATYVYGLDLISQTRNGATSYYGYDGHGSVRYLTDGTPGSSTYGLVTDTYTYDAFGVQTGGWSLNPQQPTLNNYRYAGEYSDPDLGLIYLRARYYHPDLGRFWTADSFEGFQSDPQSLNRYLYAHANPVNNVDPSGRFTLTELATTTGKMAYLGARTSFTMWQGYGRAKAAIGLVQDMATVSEALWDGLDDEDTEVIGQILYVYAQGAIINYGLRIASGAGGKATGFVGAQLNKSRITKAAIQRTRDWYSKHKLRYANTTVQTIAGPVTFDQHGWPDFSNYLYKGARGQNTVRIQLSGFRREDFRLANNAAGFGDSATAHPAGYTWHHSQKLGTVELVRQDAHTPNMNGNEWHDGAVALYRRLYGAGYDD